MKLIELLRQYECNFDDKIKRQKEKSDIRPDSVYKIELRYMCEEETWVTVYTTHPLLKQYYDCEIHGLEPIDDETIAVWLNEDNWWGD